MCENEKLSKLYFKGKLSSKVMFLKPEVFIEKTAKLLEISNKKKEGADKEDEKNLKSENTQDSSIKVQKRDFASVLEGIRKKGKMKIEQDKIDMQQRAQKIMLEQRRKGNLAVMPGHGVVIPAHQVAMQYQEYNMHENSNQGYRISQNEGMSNYYIPHQAKDEKIEPFKYEEDQAYAQNQEYPQEEYPKENQIPKEEEYDPLENF